MFAVSKKNLVGCCLATSLATVPCSSVCVCPKAFAPLPQETLHQLFNSLDKNGNGVLVSDLNEAYQCDILH